MFNSMITVKDIVECENFKEAVNMFIDMMGWTYNDMAEKTGYSYGHFYNVCVGRLDLTIKFAKRLAKVTQIEPIFWIELYMKTYEGES